MKINSFLTLLFIFGVSSLRAQQPNIVWITSEDNSIHYMKLFDSNGVETPNIERLAQHGVKFNRTFSNTSVCSAARSTLITGVYGPKLATHYHRAEQKITLPENIKMFPEYLRNAGYYTTNNLKEDYNIYKGVDVWDDSSKDANWKNRKNGQPFFHVYNIGTTHEGIVHFSEEKMKSSSTITAIDSVFIQPNHPNTQNFKYTNAFYRDQIQKMDTEVGQVIKALEEEGLLKNTIIFYYADHGGVLPNSKGYLKETGLHVPLVVYLPEKYKNLSPFSIGSSTNAFVSFVDFGATVLNLAGIEIPKTIDGKPFLGKNIKAKKLVKQDEAFGYADRFDEKYDMVRSLRKGNLKYIRNFQPFNIDGLMNNYRYKQLAYSEWKSLFDNGQLRPIQSSFFEPKTSEELYDVENDPFETINLANNPAYTKERSQLRNILNSWIKKMPDLSFYPEYYLIKDAFKNPIAFGKAHRKNINRYLKIANLQLTSFEKAKPKLLKYLKSSDELERLWALTVCSSFGEKAKEFSLEIEKIMSSDTLLLNRMRATEFFAITGIKDTSYEMINILYQSKNETEALLILNAIVLQRDFYQKLDFMIDITKIDNRVRENKLIVERLKYLELK
ncbi:sulfatase [Algibacter agarivorans]|uniref:Sulfatase n=1 Tax=Algibacter agarivorans TaxID=1109741 RepID=A0ABP9G9N6_9FLAO